MVSGGCRPSLASSGAGSGWGEVWLKVKVRLQKLSGIQAVLAGVRESGTGKN